VVGKQGGGENAKGRSCAWQQEVEVRRVMADHQAEKAAAENGEIRKKPGNRRGRKKKVSLEGNLTIGDIERERVRGEKAPGALPGVCVLATARKSG